MNELERQDERRIADNANEELTKELRERLDDANQN